MWRDVLLRLGAAFVATALWMGPAPEIAAWGDDEEEDFSFQLEIRTLPGLIDLSGIDVELEAYGLVGAQRKVLTQSDVQLSGPVRHSFGSGLSSVSVTVALFTPVNAQFVIDRLTKNPLLLTEAELSRDLPTPIGSSNLGDVSIESIEAQAEGTLDVEVKLGELELSPRPLPVALLIVDGYELTAPTASDIQQVVTSGNSCDNAAIWTWANQHVGQPQPLQGSDRANVLESVFATYSKLRSLPGYGDVHRLFSLDLLVRVLADRDDLEPLLKMQRAIQILHLGGLLSYGRQLKEEGTLGLAVHCMHRLPARDDFTRAPESGLKELRPRALDLLLRQAFDPVDFRDADPSMKQSPAQLQRTAAKLLEPLSPQDTNGVLKASEDHLDVQRRVLEFYVEVRHAPAIEPLTKWVLEHPEHLEVGHSAFKSMPSQMLAAILQRYLAAPESEERESLRKLLEKMPPSLAPELVNAMRDLGYRLDDSPSDPQAAILHALEEYELALLRQKSERVQALLEQLTHGEVAVTSWQATIGAIETLGELDPSQLERHAEALIDLFVRAAKELAFDNPINRAKALSLLTQLPWGRHDALAQRQAALFNADVAAAAGDHKEAMRVLLDFDEHLEHEDLRRAYAASWTKIFENTRESGNIRGALRQLDDAEEHIPDQVEVEALREELTREQYFLPMVIGITCLSLLALLLVGLALWTIVPRVRKARAKRRELSEDFEPDSDDVQPGRQPPGADAAAVSKIQATVALSKGEVGEFDDSDDPLGDAPFDDEFGSPFEDEFDRPTDEPWDEQSAPPPAKPLVNPLADLFDDWKDSVFAQFGEEEPPKQAAEAKPKSDDSAASEPQGEPINPLADLFDDWEDSVFAQFGDEEPKNPAAESKPKSKAKQKKKSEPKPKPEPKPKSKSKPAPDEKPAAKAVANDDSGAPAAADGNPLGNLFDDWEDAAFSQW